MPPGMRRSSAWTCGRSFFVDFAALRTEAEAIVLHFEEADGVALPGKGLVENQDGSFDAGIGIEHARRKRDDSDKGVFDQHLPQFFVGALALEDDAFGNDDAGAPGWREVLGHVVDKQHFAALGLHGEALVGLDAAFRRHERRIGQDHIGEFVPALLRGERVVLVDVRVGEAVEVEVHQREAHHVGRNVVALEVLGEAALLVWGEGAVAVRVGIGLRGCACRPR